MLLFGSQADWFHSPSIPFLSEKMQRAGQNSRQKIEVQHGRRLSVGKNRLEVAGKYNKEAQKKIVPRNGPQTRSTARAALRPTDGNAQFQENQTSGSDSSTRKKTIKVDADTLREWQKFSNEKHESIAKKQAKEL